MLLATFALAWSSRASAETEPGEKGAAEPAAEPTEARAPAPTVEPEAPPPMEFPGMIQEGTVTGARDPYARPWPTQRNLALFGTYGTFNGFGLGVRAGSLRVGLDASFSFSPILATYQADSEATPEFQFLSGFQGNASMYVGLHRLDARTDLGIAFGYKYSTLLRHGVTVAFYVQRELGAHWALLGFVGPCIFPDAENQIRKETGWMGGSVLTGIAWHQSGVGAAIAFFP